MQIRNIYTNPFNQVESSLNPVSMTLPDDSLSVTELFQKYVEGTLDRERASLSRRIEFDGYDPDIDGPSEPEDLIDVVEAAALHKERVTAMAQVEPKPDAGKNAPDVIEPNNSSKSQSNEPAPQGS